MNVHEIQIEKYGVTLIDGLGTDFILTSRQGRGDTFLSSAACTDHLNCCEEIYRRCPSLLYICNDLGETLHRAVVSNKAKNVSFFLTAGNEEHILTGRRRRMYNKELMMMPDNMGKTALHRAAELGLREIVELFIHADKPGYELLKMEDDIFERKCFDSRQGLLNLCQDNNYQFDTLHRAKHSSMMLLYYLHNPAAQIFEPT